MKKPNLSFEDNFLDISILPGQPGAEFTTSTYPGSATNNPWLPMSGGIPSNHAVTSDQNTGQTLDNLDVSKLSSVNTSVDNQFTRQESNLDKNTRVYIMPSGAELSYVTTKTPNSWSYDGIENILQRFEPPKVEPPVEPHIRNYVPLSIVVTLLFSWLFGLFALNYARKANLYKREKKYNEAVSAAHNASNLNFVGIFWGLIGNALLGVAIWQVHHLYR
ncbi:uncharacterized protein LOC131942803 [Physella acuta]|uniref:uncharacterized protein LOC131942803 n=1 Tax=Physella acuta TaxID=109671 RepID=UPI0027DD6F6D|nr:uncharacterized protein LOC131942803 [Physella acuta]